MRAFTITISIKHKTRKIKVEGVKREKNHEMGGKSCTIRWMEVSNKIKTNEKNRTAIA